MGYNPNVGYDPNGGYTPNAGYDPNGGYTPNAGYSPNEDLHKANNGSYNPEAFLNENINYTTGIPTINSLNTNTSQKQTYVPEIPETKEQFMARKVFKQLDFVNMVHAWIEARCIELGKIEIYAYKQYGFLIDVMEQVQKDIKEVLSSPAYYPALEAERSNGLQLLQNRLVALEKDLEVAYDNAPTDISPLVSEEMDADEARRMLGMIDNSNKKEYLGPAPDGFEIMEDPFAS